ncbi:putative toxin-antitoxin system toxin component, PIN family [Patescibacteria group bacterium]|nr:putative toxin-antitoxin system toxin component, PIN family [Patescibacteria group bacterium]
MRVLLDTNILISYLLDFSGKSRISKIVDKGVLGEYVILLPEELINEFTNKVLSKKYLKNKIKKEEPEEFVRILIEAGEIIPTIKEEIPVVTRDPKDDYLLACALVGEADFLVSGDKDLLVLKKVGGVRMVDVKGFEKVVLSF